MLPKLMMRAITATDSFSLFMSYGLSLGVNASKNFILTSASPSLKRPRQGLRLRTGLLRSGIAVNKALRGKMENKTSPSELVRIHVTDNFQLNAHGLEIRSKHFRFHRAMLLMY